MDNGNLTLLYPKSTGGNPNDKYAFSAVGIDTNWEPGKKYTYTLNFADNGGGGGWIDPNPTNPTDPTDPKVDPTPGTGGTPILGPINFTVTVDNWTDQSVDTNM